MLPYVFLALFLIAAVLNLIAAAKDQKALFSATKPLLLSLLCVYAVVNGLPKPDLLLPAALFFCFLGDVLLMLRGNFWFTAGGVSFLVGHILLIVIFARDVDFAHLPLAYLIPAALLYAAAVAFVICRTFKITPAFMRAPMILYLVCNGTTNIFALTRLVRAPGLWSALSYVGAILFFLSDCALCLARFGPSGKRFYKSNFFIMLTYIAGVCFITLGLSPIAAVL